MHATVAALILAALVSINCAGTTAPVTDPSTVFSAAAPLLDSVGSSVPGLSQAQSALGIGSLLGLAKGRMPANQFSEISSAIPGADTLLSEATKQGLPSKLGGLSDVNSFLGRSGITPTQVNQLIPAVGNALRGKVSPDAANAFMTSLR